MSAAYALSTSLASSLELVYAKQPIIGLTNEFFWVHARALDGSFRNN